MAKILFAFLAVIMATVAFSQEDALVQFIFANEDVCVQAYDGDKIYINSNWIIPTEKGLFLNINGVSAPISTIHSDAQGCYLTSSPS